MAPADGQTLWTVPVGVALARSMPQGSGNLNYWVMPRVHMSRLAVEGLDSEMQTDVGGSGGVGFTMASGFGLHAAIDVLAASETIIGGGVGLHFVMP